MKYLLIKKMLNLWKTEKKFKKIKMKIHPQKFKVHYLIFKTHNMYKVIKDFKKLLMKNQMMKSSNL